jgi:hypothetical protein
VFAVARAVEHVRMGSDFETVGIESVGALLNLLLHVEIHHRVGVQILKVVRIRRI